MSAPTEAAIAQRLLEVITKRLEYVGALDNSAANDVESLVNAYVSLTRAGDDTHRVVLDTGKAKP